jgi:ABC-type dipeptide/oligopeptide/nickel transport system permease component
VARAVFVLLVTSFGALVAVTEWGDPFRMIGERMQNPQTRALLNETFGLDKPLFIRYLDFIANLATGDLGIDYERRRPIIDLITETAPNTFRLALAALAIQVVFGVTLGVIAGWRRRSFVDLAITTSSIVLMSIPLFVTGVTLRNTATSLTLFGWHPFPPIPRTLGVETTWLQDLALPAITLGLGGLVFTVILTRGAMLEVLEADYIRTARAKGLTERRVIFKHAARNAMIPVAELSAISLGALMGGSIVVETIFQYRGLGYLFARSMVENNHPVMLAVAAYSVVIFVVALMLVDILTAWLDPRIRVD